MSEKKCNLYFNTLRQEKNEVCDYKFELPFFGESNTDISFYEPQSSRIANMRKAASGLSTGVYDFEAGEKFDLDKVTAPIGRKPGITFEEISQVATYNANNIKQQSNDAEEAEKAAKAAKDEAISTAKEASKVISENE